jgi:hypothetical protein
VLVACAEEAPPPKTPTAPIETAPAPATTSHGPVSCDSAIESVFAESTGEYPGLKKKLTTDVETCCRKALRAEGESGGGDFKHHWDCCNSMDNHDEGRSCTPWGPPVPPPMASTQARDATDASVLDLREAARRHLLTSLPDLPALRGSAVATWRARMINEHGSARVFDALAEQLAAAGLTELAHEAAAFGAEERNHGVLCGAVVESLGGEARADIEAAAAYPLHEDAATPLEATVRNLLSICCLSETVAVSLIGAERLEMPEGQLRDLLTRIYADEVGHARFGWRALAQLAPTLDAAAKARLGAYLAVAFAHLEEHEPEHLPETAAPPPEGVAYGLCNGRDARSLFFATVDEVILPALEAHGLPARAAWNASSARAGA